MKHNPFASIFRQAFHDDVLNHSTFLGKEKADTPQRVNKFISSLNNFMQQAELPALDISHYAVPEKHLIHYALFLRGYMRDAMAYLNNLTSEYSLDNNLVALFKASSQYVVACNNHVPNHTNTYDEQSSYRTWKLDPRQYPQQIDLSDGTAQINPDKKNLLLFMPYHIKDNITETQKWLYKNMGESLASDFFRQQNVDIFTFNFPIKKSRCAKIYTTLKTMQEPDSYFEAQDMELVQKNFLPFIGKGLKLDNNYRIISGQKYSPEELKSKLGNITIFSYCSGTTDAHRCLNGLKNVALQLYPEPIINDAMKNIYLISYGFLPFSRNTSYSGAHLMTNKENDFMQKEVFAKMNRPELYEKVKYTPSAAPARISLLPDRRNYIIAFKMPETTVLFDAQNIGQLTLDTENGHRCHHITSRNLNSQDNFAFYQFTTILENACEGKRGVDVFNRRKPQHLNNYFTTLQLLNNQQRL